MSCIRTKLLDEVQAWDKLARAFERYDQTGVPSVYSRTGLSIAVSKLAANRHITMDTELSMKQRIKREWVKAQRRMPEDHAHAKARAERARAFQKEAFIDLIAKTGQEELAHLLQNT
jgi:hypothetical protein